MAFYNRREFLQASAASAYLFSTLKLNAAPSAPAKIQETAKSVRVEGKNYAWEWSPEDDKFRLLHRWGMALARGPPHPAGLGNPAERPGPPVCPSGKPARHEVRGN